MQRKHLLIVTALAEVGTGVVLLVQPSVVFRLLLGVSFEAPEAVVVGRITGAALLAIGVACWLARNDRHSPAQRGVLIGVLIYDAAAAVLLAYAALELSLAGIVLWPAAALHTVLAGWCVACLWRQRMELSQLGGSR